MCDGCWCRLTTAFAVSHKRYTNRHLDQHMIHVLRYCDEAQASLCKCADSPSGAFAACQHIDTYCIVQWLYLSKCADSTESKLLAWIAHKSPFEPAHDISLLWRGSGQPAQMWRLNRVYAAGVNITQIAISGSTWYFGTVTKATVSLCKCVDSPEPSLLAQTSIKPPFEPAQDFWTVTKAQTRSSHCAVSP